MSRSILFTPATQLDRLEKALAAEPDWVALDLEDGVGPADKETARAALTAFAESGMEDFADRLAVRINAPDTHNGIRDLAALLDWPLWPGVLILPKVEAAAQVRQIVRLFSNDRGRPRLLLSLETAAGIADAAAIARAAPEGALFGYGSADHMAETGGTMTEASLAYGRAQVINAAALAGCPALDGVWLDYKDLAGLRAEAELAKSLGFAGKIAIHPGQIATINQVFSPTQEEIGRAREMVAAAEAAGGGAFAFKGKMVDAPVLQRAKRTIDRGE